MLQCFLIKKDITSDVNMSHEKMSNFGSFLLLGFTLVTKPRNCDFESHWNILTLFHKKKDVRFDYVLCPLSDLIYTYFGNKLRNTNF